MKKSRRINFTLIELLAAMAVFSILLVVSMRLFSGAQQIWMRSEQKTDTFASARTAMEFIASRMQTIYYHNDEPFEITDGVSSGTYEMDSIWFLSNMPKADGSKHLHFVKFRLENPTGSDPRAGMLQLLKYTGDENYQTYRVMQVNLTVSNLDRCGIIWSLSHPLAAEAHINLLYLSTFNSANILVNIATHKCICIYIIYVGSI
jgi:prepilin-type N-terminal cleavage/methylation domain-containing protein